MCFQVILDSNDCISITQEKKMKSLAKIKNPL
jgi:hypothetical protein